MLLLKLIVGDGPVGTFSFTVNIAGKGITRMNSATTFSFTLAVSGISPTVAGTGG